jgi:hypothetical protein
MCPGCRNPMIVAVSRGASGREYVCDQCGSAVAGVAVFRTLLGDRQAGRIWAGSEAPPDAESGDKPVSCGFCFSSMQPRVLDSGRAAICKGCQVMWFDREALESQTTSTSPLRLSQVGVARCGNCGAGIPSPLDHHCRYCGSAFSVEPQSVVMRPVQRDAGALGDVAEITFCFARAVGAVLDWYPWS